MGILLESVVVVDFFVLSTDVLDEDIEWCVWLTNLYNRSMNI